MLETKLIISPASKSMLRESTAILTQNWCVGTQIFHFSSKALSPKYSFRLSISSEMEAFWQKKELSTLLFWLDAIIFLWWLWGEAGSIMVGVQSTSKLWSKDMGVRFFKNWIGLSKST